MREVINTTCSLPPKLMERNTFNNIIKIKPINVHEWEKKGRMNIFIQVRISGDPNTFNCFCSLTSVTTHH